jgi:hypothetical protein
MLKFIPLSSFSLHKPFIFLLIYESSLPSIQNYNVYKKYIHSPNTPFHFLNLTNDTYLLCPFPIKNKNYATIRFFIKNSSQLEQLQFWFYTANISINYLNNNIPIYIHTHGLGVSYLHLRFDTNYKYPHHLPNTLNKSHKIINKSINKWYKLFLHSGS